MKVWILDCDVDSFENLIISGDSCNNLLKTFNGEEKNDGWTPISVRKMYGDREFSNTPGFAPHIPVFDNKAVSELSCMLKNEAEILPLHSEDGTFYAINVIDVLDCIDYKKSEYKTFRDGKRIMCFTKYSFIESIIKKHNIFKIKDEPLKRPFVSDEFKNIVQSSGLIGFKFELAWESENK